MKSEHEIIDSANQLADKFYNATHPTEVLCWDMAVEAYQHINGTDVNNTLEEIGEY